MKMVSLLLISFMLTFLPSMAKTTVPEKVNEDAPKVFIYHIPDDVVKEDTNVSSSDKKDEKVSDDIVSDDITADTSGVVEQEEEYNPVDEVYKIDDMYSDVLQGYAVYDEEEDAISLEDELDEFQMVKIKKPVKVKGGKYSVNKSTALPTNLYSKLNNMEYTIEQKSYDTEQTFGKFSAGTQYKQKIDYAEFRQSTVLYSRYDTKYMAFNTEFSKTVNSTNGDFNDYFSFAPELKLGQYLSLKETVSANFAKNIKIAEFVLSINPFGKKDIDRFNIELGTSSIFDENNSLVKNRFKVTTNFKL